MFPTTKVLTFFQGFFLNWKIDITWCSRYQHKPTINYPINDQCHYNVNELANQCPIVWLYGKSSPHPLFLCPRLEWKNKYEVCFTTSPIGCNQLCLTINNLTFDFFPWKKKTCPTRVEVGWGLYEWIKISIH
jgi:hypothetical protein